MSDVVLFDNLVDGLCAKGSLSAEDVLDLRRRIFPDGVVSQNEMEAVFRLDQACTTKDGSWSRFYVDALTDYFVWQSKPRGYVSDELTGLLIDRITRDGRIDSLSELELLLNVVHWATWCPERLSVFALEAVRDSVLTPADACYGSNRRPFVIAPADVEIIRKVIYAPGSPGGFTVTRAEAELMFALNDATVEAENAPSWQDLFVKAIANHLMFPRGAPVVPDAEEELRREAWLESRPGIGKLLMNVGRSIGRRDVPFSEVWKDLDLFGTQRAKEEQEKEDARLRESMLRESIDAEEAAWLTAQVMRDGVLHASERALLVFIKAHAPHIDPSLNALFEKAGV